MLGQELRRVLGLHRQHKADPDGPSDEVMLLCSKLVNQMVRMMTKRILKHTVDSEWNTSSLRNDNDGERQRQQLRYTNVGSRNFENHTPKGRTEKLQQRKPLR